MENRYADGLLDEIMYNTTKYLEQFPKKERKEHGQFFTTAETAAYMASLVRTEQKKVQILDPGSGNGMLAAAAAAHLIQSGEVKELKM